MEILYDIAVGAWQTLAEMSPYLLFGFAVAGLLSVFLSTVWVERHLGGGGTWSVVKASALGVPLPLCSCGVIPVSASLREKGAGKGATTSFLISTPQTGADSIFVTYSLLGPFYAIYRPLLALVSGVIGGVLTNFWAKDKAAPDAQTLRQSDGEAQGDGSCCSKIPEPEEKPRRRLREFWQHGFVTLPRDIGKALLLGVLISALITALVPDDFLSGALGTGFTGMLVMLAVAVPMYVCATASVPIAAALILKGASPGAALVFLMTGPATNAATIATVWKVMGRRTAMIYLLTMIGCAIAGGLLLDAVLPVAQIRQHVPHGEMALPLWKMASAFVLLGLLGWAILGPKLRRAQPDQPADQAAEDHKTLQVEGMTCSHCAASVTESLLALPGVDSAQVDVDSGQAHVAGRDLQTDALRGAVEGRGYKLAGVK
ncbi:MAG: SO_0444 family Cu/Zn efflux transporter [Phycisphaerae bacterium]